MEATCAIIAGLVGHFTLVKTGTPADQLTARNRRRGDMLIAFAVLHVFLLSFFATRIAEKIGPLILLIFFGMFVFGFVYVYVFIPETKGLSLEEVDEMYRSGVKLWNPAGWRPTEKHIHDKNMATTDVREVNEKGDQESA